MQTVKPSRIQILTDQEIHELYSRPVFNQSEREEYFSVDPRIEKVLSTLGKVETRIYLLLLIYYFLLGTSELSQSYRSSDCEMSNKMSITFTRLTFQTENPNTHSLPKVLEQH
nr:hypothetical protein [Vibrio sonorensis]